MPLNEHTLCQFAATLSLSVGWQTIRSYISALRYYQISYGLPDPSLQSFPRLSYVLRGIHRSKPDHLRRRRLPITPSILRALHGVWAKEPCSFNSRMLWAACCLGFFGFMRAGEFTSGPADDHPALLSAADISVDSISEPRALIVHLRHSKTDPFQAGCHIHLGRTYQLLCPVAALLGYLAARPPTPGPLFIFDDGSPLSRPRLVSQLQATLRQAGILTDGYTGHSFRIGAATAAAQAGLSDSIIQKLGRWKSATFTTYIHPPVDRLLQASSIIITP